MNTMTRRAFGLHMGTLLAGGYGAGLLRAAAPDKREPLPVAAIVTEYRRNSHVDAIADVFRKHKRVVPLFNDKHLAYSWRDAKHMYDTARDMSIPFLAGSSLPVAWRTPALNLPPACVLTGALALGYGGLESYGFH